MKKKYPAKNFQKLLQSRVNKIKLLRVVRHARITGLKGLDSNEFLLGMNFVNADFRLYSWK